MANEKMVFDIGGPTHLTQVDWYALLEKITLLLLNVSTYFGFDFRRSCPDHKRIVAASLVVGVYVLESDRQLSHQEHAALASPWWEFFHFRLIRKLIDPIDSSIFAAVYELVDQSSSPSVDRPSHVLALRGTMRNPDTLSRDLEHDIEIIRHGLHTTSRFLVTMQVLRDLVHSQHPKSTVWVAGHSLGSALGMLAGKTMAKEGVLIESFFFNPPFISAPLERIQDRKIKHGLRVAGSIVVAGLALAKKVRDGERRTKESTFDIIAAWVPRLFVNPFDYICAEYLGYFRHREKMDELGIGLVERISTRHSIGGLLLGSFFGEDHDPVHLIPSADLTVNVGSSPDLKTAHGIHQWLCPDLNFEHSVHRY